MQTWTTPDEFDARDEWDPGAWDNEPDKAVWVDEVTDLDCMIHRNRLGALCGYVGVPNTHPAYGRDYDNVDVEVHGGLTYAARCQEGTKPEHGICHVPEPGRPTELWWLGFDCHHAFDLAPGMVIVDRLLEERSPELKASGERLRSLQSQLHSPRSTYKDFEYVKREVEHLAAQLAQQTPARVWWRQMFGWIPGINTT